MESNKKFFKKIKLKVVYLGFFFFFFIISIRIFLVFLISLFWGVAYLPHINPLTFFFFLIFQILGGNPLFFIQSFFFFFFSPEKVGFLIPPFPNFFFFCVLRAHTHSLSLSGPKFDVFVFFFIREQDKWGVFLLGNLSPGTKERDSPKPNRYKGE